MELFCKSFPALVFLITALVRYVEVQPIGFSRTTIYSKLYRFKLYTQYLQVLLEILIITLYFVEPLIKNRGHNHRASTYIFEARWFSLVFCVNMVAWLVAARLMRYEYRKRLSEAFYAHWFFWSLMLIDNVVFLILNFAYYEWYLIAINCMQMTLNLALNGMMVITKQRTINNPRPDQRLLLFEGEVKKDLSLRRRSSKRYADGVYISGSEFIDVKMSRKVVMVSEMSGRTLSESQRNEAHKYEFTVNLIKQ